MNRMPVRKNITRRYTKFVIGWDAKEYFKLNCASLRNFPFELRKVGSHQIAPMDSIHRNIAESYRLRSLQEYVPFSNEALASAGESVSGLHVYALSGQIASAHFEKMDALAHRIENGRKRLIERLQQKQSDDAWQKSFVVCKFNEACGAAADSESEHSTIPSFQYSHNEPERSNT